jgi:hypothetical protein
MRHKSPGDGPSPVRTARTKYPELAPRRPKGLPPAMLWPDWTDGHRYGLAARPQEPTGRPDAVR